MQSFNPLISLNEGCACVKPSVLNPWERKCRSCGGGLTDWQVALKLRLDNHTTGRKRIDASVSGGKSGQEALSSFGHKSRPITGM